MSDTATFYALKYGNKVDVRKLEEFEGKVLESVTGLEKDSDEIFFEFKDGTRYIMYHSQDCCECVLVEDFENDVNDFNGALVTMAEEVSHTDDTGRFESATWTFYKIETNRGGLWIRWLGQSNGYYSESVYVKEITGDVV